MDPSVRSRFHTLEYRYLMFLVAVWTSPMDRFGTLHRLLHHISINSRSNLFKLIALLFSFPCFELSNLCFKRAYAINQRRAFLINRENMRLGIDECPIEFDQLSLKGLSIPQRYHRLRDVLQRLERCQSRSDSAHIRHRIFLLERALARAQPEHSTKYVRESNI